MPLKSVFQIKISDTGLDLESVGCGDSACDCACLPPPVCDAFQASLSLF